MATEILMPALSPTMEEGKLAKWLVKEGDEVHSGDILAEIETDKATMEFEAVDEGRIARLLVPEGQEGIKVNQPIATLLQSGEETTGTAAISAKAPAREKKRRCAEASGGFCTKGAVRATRRGAGAQRCVRRAERSRNSRRCRNGHDDGARGAARRHGRRNAA